MPRDDFERFLERYSRTFYREPSQRLRARRKGAREEFLQQRATQQHGMLAHPYRWDAQCRTGLDLRGGYWNFAAWLDRRRISPRPTGPTLLPHVTHRLVPNHTSGPFAHAPGDKLFVGQFSRSGDTFVSASQGGSIRLYGTAGLWAHRGRRLEHQERVEQAGVDAHDAAETFAPLPPFKTIEARCVGWSIVDVDFSPDQQYLIYSSWSNFVHLCNVHGPVPVHTALDLKPASRRHFCPFSIRFSPGGREIIAGTSEAALYLYDLDRQERILRIQAHENDINSVAFVEDWSSHLFLSGADDGLCKVWDRRCAGERQNVGCLVGHTDGIVYVTSRGDGRFVATSSKDQTLKLFDLRAMGGMDRVTVWAQRTTELMPQWDYRYSAFPEDLIHVVHPNDMSVMTYRGHSVLQTLIRCHFSPTASTGQRYLYTGSHDGGIYIYDTVTGNLVRRLMHHQDVVRDVSWHPTLPLLCSTSWDGRHVAFDYRQPPDGPLPPESYPPYRRPRRAADVERACRKREFHPPVAVAESDSEDEGETEESPSTGHLLERRGNEPQEAQRQGQRPRWTLQQMLLAMFEAEAEEEAAAAQDLGPRPDEASRSVGEAPQGQGGTPGAP